jgi:hypothetical protein
MKFGEIILMLALLIAILSIVFGDPLQRPFRVPFCLGRAWKKRFPKASKYQICKFLQVFADAFAFKKAHLLKFRPEDKIMDIYRSLSSGALDFVDACELESLRNLLIHEYGIDLARFWRIDLTLGQMFEIITGHKPELAHV